MELTDDIWQVICDHLLKYKGIVGNNDIRRYIEDNMEIIPFDGGVLIVKDNEFDLFVLPEKRGKWRIRSTANAFFKHLAQKYDVAKASINKDNSKSLRLAKFFGFKEVHRDGDDIILERRLWAEQSAV